MLLHVLVEGTEKHPPPCSLHTVLQAAAYMVKLYGDFALGLYHNHSYFNLCYICRLEIVYYIIDINDLWQLTIAQKCIYFGSSWLQ